MNTKPARITKAYRLNIRLTSIVEPSEFIRNLCARSALSKGTCNFDTSILRPLASDWSSNANSIQIGTLRLASPRLPVIRCGRAIGSTIYGTRFAPFDSRDARRVSPWRWLMHIYITRISRPRADPARVTLTERLQMIWFRLSVALQISHHSQPRPWAPRYY